MSILDFAFSLARAVLSAGFAIYAYMTYLKLRGGLLAQPYLILAICGIVGVFSTVSDAFNYEVAHGLLGIVFFLLLFLGCWMIYQSWSTLGLRKTRRS